MSRWMIPFWCACWIAWQTGTNSSNRCRSVSRRSSQKRVMGTPLTNSMTKKGRPLSMAPASSTRAMLGWSIIARACRSASKRARTALESMPALMTFTATSALDRLGLLGHEDRAHAAFADLFQQLVAAGDDLADLRGGILVISRRIGRRPAGQLLKRFHGPAELAFGDEMVFRDRALAKGVGHDATQVIRGFDLCLAFRANRHVGLQGLRLRRREPALEIGGQLVVARAAWLYSQLISLLIWTGSSSRLAHGARFQSRSVFWQPESQRC